MTPCPHTISRAYIAGNIPARPLPRGAIDLAGLDFGQEETEVQTPYLLGLHPMVFLVCATLAAVCWAALTLQGY